MSSTPPKYRISQIKLADPIGINHRGMDPAVLVPAVSATVIAENGGIYRRTFYGLGCTPDKVRDAWDNEQEKFLKVDPSASENPTTRS